mgnify:CR=1 FL=1
MSDENKHLEKAAVENEIAHLTILRGDAPKQHNPQPVSISGNIDAPSLFIEGRKNDFANSQRHCMVSKTDGTIVLHLNEQSVVDKYTVSGKIEIGKKFEALGINSEKGYNPEELANNGEHFGLKISGDSMIEAGINDGDTIIVKKTSTANNGQIVVALIDDHEAMLKRIRKKGKVVALESANKRYETKIFGPDRVKVQGVLVSLYRNFQ